MGLGIITNLPAHLGGGKQQQQQGGHGHGMSGIPGSPYGYNGGHGHGHGGYCSPATLADQPFTYGEE